MGRALAYGVRAEPERSQLGELDQVVLALGDPCNRKLARGLVTKPDVFSRNVPNPLHAGQHGARKPTRGLQALRNGRYAVVLGHIAYVKRFLRESRVGFGSPGP